MRKLNVIAVFTAAAVCVGTGCAAKTNPAAPVEARAVGGHGSKSVVAAAPVAEETAMPTVPPAGTTPEPQGTPVPRPAAETGKGSKNKKSAASEVTGPVVTFFGAARADGSPVEPVSVDKGVPTYLSSAGSGFILVVEGKPGTSGLEVGRQVFVHDPADPSLRPDLEIESNRDLGNGSKEVCDRRRPNIGGIPAVNPTSFAQTQAVSDALNDFSCRFETFIESEMACTVTANGDFSFRKPDSTMQFCMMVAKAYQFDKGETLLTVRLRDREGNPGPPAQMRIRREEPKRKPTPKTAASKK